MTATGRGGTSRLPVDAGVYVHFPYCVHRCHYCDFNTRAVRRVPARRYADAVLAELERRAPALAGHRVVSLYFGGGTPGLWGPRELGRVVRAVEQTFGVHADDLEVTVEVNPGECSEAMLRAYRQEAGCNRVSVGVQAFDDALLRRLDRIHDAAAARAVAAAIPRAGFSRWSLDLMFGLPGQTLAQWRATLEAALATGVPHLSVYNLTVEGGTPLAALVRRGRVRLLPDDVQRAMMELAHERLEAAGYVRYEISNYARGGQASRHNRLYWTGRAYLGLGAGAHSWLPRPTRPGVALGQGAVGVREAVVRDDRRYVEAALGRGDVVATSEFVEAAAHVEERLFTGLRLLDEGVDLACVRRVTGVDVAARYGARARALEEAGWLVCTPQRWRLTRRGIAVADAVIARLLA